MRVASDSFLQADVCVDASVQPHTCIISGSCACDMNAQAVACMVIRSGCSFHAECRGVVVCLRSCELSAFSAPSVHLSQTAHVDTRITVKVK